MLSMNFFKRLFSVRRRQSEASNQNGYFHFLFSPDQTWVSDDTELRDNCDAMNYSVEDQDSFNGFDGGDFGGGGASDSWGDFSGGDSGGDGGGGD